MTISDYLSVPATADDALIDRLRHTGSACSYPRGQTVARAGDADDCVHVIAAGCAVAVKRTSDGLQQNVAIFLPRDIVGHEMFTLGASRCDAVALTPVIAHRVSLSALRDAIDVDRDHAAAFWRHVAFHGTLAHEWLLSIGRRPAYARTAHLLCEIIHRSGARGNGDIVSCAMPLTQTELADTLGLSVVHVNRTLMRFKDEKLARLRRGHIEVHDWPRFKAAAGFEAGYLNSRA